MDAADLCRLAASPDIYHEVSHTPQEIVGIQIPFRLGTGVDIRLDYAAPDKARGSYEPRKVDGLR